MKRLLSVAVLIVMLACVSGCSCTDSYFSSMMTLSVKHYCPCYSTCYKNAKHDADSCGCSRECSCWGGKTR